jgi:hypothetical protein
MDKQKTSFFFFSWIPGQVITLYIFMHTDKKKTSFLFSRGYQDK